MIKVRVLDIWYLFDVDIVLNINDEYFDVTPEILQKFGNRKVNKIFVGDGDILMEVE